MYLFIKVFLLIEEINIKANMLISVARGCIGGNDICESCLLVCVNSESTNDIT